MEPVFDDKLPIYLQIINYLKSELISGNLKPGDKLPSVRDLSSSLKVNPNTIARVYQELEREGITFTQRGTGTFIREDSKMIVEIRKDMAKEMIDTFLEGMKNMGFVKEEVIRAIDNGWKE
jgi:DNA-binding transcriptional regulator YhcF (GntR family)